MTQEALQLENFSFNKRMRIVNQYKDMRREMGFEIRSMWFNLGQYKVWFTYLSLKLFATNFAGLFEFRKVYINS